MGGVQKTIFSRMCGERNPNLSSTPQNLENIGFSIGTGNYEIHGTFWGEKIFHAIFRKMTKIAITQCVRGGLIRV